MYLVIDISIYADRLIHLKSCALAPTHTVTELINKVVFVVWGCQEHCELSVTVCSSSSSRQENTKRDEGGSDACVLEDRRESRLDSNRPVGAAPQPLYANAAVFGLLCCGARL